MPGSFEVGDLVTADLLNTATYRPYCKVHQTVAQTGLASGSTTTITFTTEDHDPEGWHDNVTNSSRITPNIAGEYEIIAEGSMAASTTINSVNTAIFFNGALLSRSANVKPSATSNTATFAGIAVDTVTCNGTTDYIEMAINLVNSGTEATNVATSGQSRLIVRFLGANA